MAERPKNYRLGDIITGIRENIKSPAQQSVNKHFSLDPVKPIQPKNGVEKKTTALLQGAKVLMPKMPATQNGGFIHSLTGKESPVKAENENITESRRRMISPTKKVDSTPAEAAPNAESSPIKSTSENSIRNSAGNVKKFRSCAFLRVGES